jgi:hypothetical protein
MGSFIFHFWITYGSSRKTVKLDVITFPSSVSSQHLCIPCAGTMISCMSAVSSLQAPQQQQHPQLLRPLQRAQKILPWSYAIPHLRKCVNRNQVVLCLPITHFGINGFDVSLMKVFLYCQLGLVKDRFTV